MTRTVLERISQREYAARLGISNSAVSNAVKDGRIKKGWDKKTQKIIVEHADAEFGRLHLRTNIPTVDENEEQPRNSASLTLNGNSTYADAKRVKEILQAQIVAIELREKKGELVNKEYVHKQLYTFGQNLRISLSAIPDRTIDEILAATTRQEAHQILTTAIYSALEELSAYKIEDKR